MIRKKPDATEQTLRRIPLFAACRESELRRLRRHADVVTVAPGAVLARQGDLARWAYIVVDGRVAGAGPGAVLGATETLRQERFRAALVAETGATVLVLGRRELAAALDEVPGFARRVLLPLVPDAGPVPAPTRPRLLPLSVA